MLSNLLIKNYALIQHLEMQPADGLNIITGETGAGKSIMLGAIGLLMGNRADTKVLLQKDQKCVIEGTFGIESYALEKLFEDRDWEYDTQTIIRREISTSGKSRAFINDSPVNLEALRTLGQNLLDIHSQMDTLKLRGRQFQLEVVDALGNCKHILNSYQEVYQHWTSIKKKHAELQAQSQQKQQEGDYKNFLLEELEAASLVAGEQESLEASLSVMEHAEEIKVQIQNSLQLLSDQEYNADQLLVESANMLRKIQEFGPEYHLVFQRLQSAQIEINDIAEELRQLDHRVEHDPQEIERLKSRLDTIYRLQKKHLVNDIGSLIAIRDQIAGDLEHLVNLDDELSELEEQIRVSEQDLMKVGNELSEQRQKSFPEFKHQLELLLAKLGMPESTLEITCQKIAPGSYGLDDIQWLFSANKGVPVQPISKVASGGEFSRLMFCIKYLLADKMALPTVLFDEIDTGISGEVALQMIEMMHTMSDNHQVLTISHLPQFAAKGDHHYFVYKETTGDTTTSGIRKLEQQERVEKIAEMLGGNNPSEIAYANAKELMGANGTAAS